MEIKKEQVPGEMKQRREDGKVVLILESFKERKQRRLDRWSLQVAYTYTYKYTYTIKWCAYIHSVVVCSCDVSLPNNLSGPNLCIHKSGSSDFYVVCS